jgi:dual specificity tyrosine-phosphorylation-regulated kinase 2/3/4
MEKQSLLKTAHLQLRVASPEPHSADLHPSSTKSKPNKYEITLTNPFSHTSSLLQLTSLKPQKSQLLTPTLKPRPKISPKSIQLLSFPANPKLFPDHILQLLPNSTKSELLEYDEVYFLPKSPSFLEECPCFDDESGDYKVNVADHLAYRYEIVEILGKGTYGQVVKCLDHKRRELVAIKIIKNHKRFHKQAVVELKILQKLRANDQDAVYNVVKIKNYFLFRKHICITFELLSINLYELLVKNNFEGVSLTLIHRFAVQLLVCLQYLKKHSVIHCDLKPENILLKSQDRPLINVIDFGSSCYSGQVYATYIQSRFYRAPEVVLGLGYSFEIDMWGLGCILVELFTGVPLFPAESEVHLMACIARTLGPAPGHMLSRSPKRDLFCEPSGEMKRVHDKRGVIAPGSRRLEDVLGSVPATFADFVGKCIAWDPAARITPLDGLEHEWVVDGLRRKGHG